jgi:hypothetical protein
MKKNNFEYKFTKFNVNNKEEIADLVRKFGMPVVPGTEAYIDWHRAGIPLKTWDYIMFIFNRLPREMMKLDNLITVLELRYMGLQSSEKNMKKIKNANFRRILEKQIPISKKETLNLIAEVKEKIRIAEEEARKSTLDEFLI